MMSHQCARKALCYVVDEETGEQQYTDPDTGWVESADDWNTHDGEVKVPKPLRILPERRNDKEAIANVECLLRADAEWLWKTKICRQDDDARAAQNARNRESYAEKKKAREAVFDAGIDIPEAPSADAFVQGLQIEATLLKNPEVAAFVSVYKGTADPKEGKGGVIEWKVRKYEERGTFSAPGRVNHVLTPGGYHFLNRDMQLLRNLKCPKGKAGFNSKFSVVAGGNDGAFEREKQLITALEERKKLAESVSDRIIILNCVGGGNGSRSIGGAGCAGISVLYATPNQVRFNKMGNEEHQCNIRNQAPLSFRQLVDMNDKKLATIAKPKKSTEKRRAKRAEEEKRTKEQRRDELNSKRAGKSATPKPFNTKRKASPTSVSDPDFDSASATEKQSGSKAVKQASSSSAKQSKAKRSVPSRKSPSAAKKQASISSAQQPESSVAVSRKKPPVAVKPSTAPSKQPECPGAPAEAKKLPVSSEKKRPEAAVASDNPPPAKKQKSEKEEAKKSNFFGVRK
ncbi:hypothetical protein ACHAXT_001479 [Thalassiosira profunda]